MNNLITKLLLKELKKIIDLIENNQCELEDDEAEELLNTISHRAITKAEACEYLNISRSRFDDYVAMNILPKGKKRKGSNELKWYKDELDKAAKNIVRNNKTNNR